MEVIYCTHESDVVSDVSQLSLAFLEYSVCRNIRNEMFHHDILSFAIAIAVVYFLVAPVICSKLPSRQGLWHFYFPLV